MNNQMTPANEAAPAGVFTFNKPKNKNVTHVFKLLTFFRN